MEVVVESEEEEGRGRELDRDRGRDGGGSDFDRTDTDQRDACTGSANLRAADKCTQCLVRNSDVLLELCHG